MAARFSIATLLGATTTLVLLWVMQLLIAESKVLQPNTAPKHPTVLVAVHVPPPPPPPEYEKPSPPAPVPTTPGGGIVIKKLPDNSSPLAPVPVPGPPAAEIGPISIGIQTNADGDVINIFSATPIYPNRPLAQELEGYVDIRFTVTVAGSVRDPEVIFSSHRSFESAALKAIGKFKYKPRVVNGEPVEASGIETRIRFKIED